MRGPRRGVVHLSTLAAVQARNRLRKPVSVTYRTGLGYAETEIGKWRPETGAAKPPVQRRNSRICQPETPARQPNPRECRRFSHTRKEHSGDRTGWLGWEDLNSQMSLPKLCCLQTYGRVAGRLKSAAVCELRHDRQLFGDITDTAHRIANIDLTSPKGLTATSSCHGSCL